MSATRYKFISVIQGRHARSTNYIVLSHRHKLHFFVIFEKDLVCLTTCEFFKKLNFHLPKRLVQFSFSKIPLVQINSKLNEETVRLPIHM